MPLSRPDAAAAFALHRKTLAALSRSAAVGSGDLQTSLRELTELATQILDVDRASVWRLRPDGTAIECVDLYERTHKRHSTGMVLEQPMAPAYFAAVASQDVIAANQALTDPRTREFADSYLAPLGISAMLDIPVFRGDQLYGVICHEQLGPAREWTQWDELLGTSIADMLAFVLNLAERVAAERALAEHQQRGAVLQQIFTAAPIPLVLTGLDDAVVRFCNARAAEMFGIGISEIVGRRAPEFYADPASRTSFVDQLRREGRVESHPARLKTSTGEPFWALMSAHTLELNGDRMFMVGFVNITRQKETEAELQRLNTSLSQTLRVLEDRDRHIREDLDEARGFQRLILPTLPTDARVGFAALYRPTAEVGGDIYDVFELEPGTFRVFVADARGHGVQAALRTMLLKSEYERVRREPAGPAAVLEQLNSRICIRYPGMHLQCTAACFDVVTDGKGGARVIYAAAAHPPFLHITSAGSRELILSGPHLGVLPEVSVESAEVYVARGERFIAYTDGIYEQPGPKGEMYGVDRMGADMTLDVPLDDVPSRMLAALETFAGSQPLVDDITLVAIEPR